MQTDDLITLLAKEPVGPAPAAPMARGLTLALALGVPVVLALFFAMLGPRPDLVQAVANPVVLAKTVLPLVLALLALPMLLPAARPGTALPRWRRALWLLPVIAAGMFVGAFVATAPGARLAGFIGNSILICLPAITLLSLPLLAGLIAALRPGAPEHPGRLGALAGLAAAGLATTIYSTFCTEDTPLFYAVWYSLGIAIVTGLGALAGRRWLRW